MNMVNYANNLLSGMAQMQGTTVKANILLVEDDSVIRSILFDMLCHYGYNVTSVSNGHDAYAVFVGAPDDGFDVVVSDYHMPGIYGDTLRRNIFTQCDDNGRARPAFIIMSGAWAPALGGSHEDGFIAKPFAGDQLHEMIQRMVSKRRAA